MFCFDFLGNFVIFINLDVDMPAPDAGDRPKDYII